MSPRARYSLQKPTLTSERREANEDVGLFEEPVDCSVCGRIHELQESFFCFNKCDYGQGLCKRCARNHRMECA